MKETPDKVKNFLGVCLDGLPFFFAFVAMTIILFLWKGFWLALPMGIISLWCLWFFRDPDRQTMQISGHAVVSPADGTVIQISEVGFPYLLEGRALRVSIFMSVFNVHVNRIPMAGVIDGLQYHKGKFLGAFSEKASLDNEQMGIVVDTGVHKIMFVQIAGFIARRIVCRLTNGEEVRQGQRFGLIRFGSRVDVYLPPHARLSIKLGDKVKSGKTLLGDL